MQFCAMIILIDWLVFSVQRAIVQLYSGRAMIIYMVLHKETDMARYIANEIKENMPVIQ